MPESRNPRNSRYEGTKRPLNATGAKKSNNPRESMERARRTSASAPTASDAMRSTVPSTRTSRARNIDIPKGRAVARTDSPERSHRGRAHSRPSTAKRESSHGPSSRTGSRASTGRRPSDGRPARSHVRTTAAKTAHGRPSAERASNPVSWLWSKSKIAVTILFICIAVALLIVLDLVFTSGRILKGVHVGDVDVSNMTVAEASAAIAEVYEPRLTATTLYIFADEETASSEDLDLQILESESTAEQLSFEEAQENKKLWITSAADLEASLPTEELAEQAYQAGRDAGIIERIATSFQGHEVDVYATFGEMPLSNLISDIDSTLGEEMHDFGVSIDDGDITVTEGNDGYMLDSDEFCDELSDSLLRDESSIVGFIADIQFTPLRINREEAQITCDAISKLVPNTVSFAAEDEDVDIWRNTVLDWIRTEPKEIPPSARSDAEAEEGDDYTGYYLDPSIDIDKASSSLLSFIEEGGRLNEVNVEFIIDGEDVLVQPESDVRIPKVDDALRTLDDDLFARFRETLEAPEEADVPTIDVTSTISSDLLTLDEALAYGVVDRIATFTTKYTNTSSTQGRTFNVHHAADLLNNSIAPANADWSFNEVVGPCDEEHGFQEAKVIEAGEYTSGIGGGICQVATTVFNAAYEAGLPIVKRRNHSLHSSSYPAGRDAAIAYPTSDLIWSNNTDEDILVRTSYTDTSLTVTLIGSDPGNEVETVTGEWKEGKKHGLKFEIDENMAANTAYVKTAGTDGMEITVTRTVKDKDGKVTIQDDFISSYAPITQVVVCGEGSDMDALRQKYEPKES